jgi:hypothetical protein
MKKENIPDDRFSNKIRLKFKAIIDIIKSKKFYLITFTDNDEVNWRTQYNINADDIHDKI